MTGQHPASGAPDSPSERESSRPDPGGEAKKPDIPLEGEPEIGPQTAQINLNLRNPVQANVYASPESRAAFHELEELLLGSERTMTRREAAKKGDLSLLNARKIWRAMGFPNLSDEEVYFTDGDAEALREIAGLVLDDEITEEGTLSLVRAMAQMTDRMVVWQVEAMVEDLVMNGDYTDAGARRELLRLLPRLMPTLEKLLLYSWRRQLNAAVQRLAMRQERPDGSTVSGLRDVSDEDDSKNLPLARGIGFADMVSYTSLSRQMNERTLAHMVQHFESKCAEIISIGGGRLVKTVGDEVLYNAETPEAGAEIALALAESIAADGVLPEARVSVVWGRVLSRMGDIYGPTVNLAARLTSLADPGTILVDQVTAQTLESNPDYLLVPQPPRIVRGFGEVQPNMLLRGQGAGFSNEAR